MKKEIIEFNNNFYLARRVKIKDVGEVLISTESLNEALMKDGKYTSEEARNIDEKIYFFVEDEHINLTEKELSKYVYMMTH